MKFGSSHKSGESSTGQKLNKSGGLNISVNLRIAGSDFKSLTLDLAESAVHETLIHVYMITGDFLDNNKLDESNISDYTKGVEGITVDHYEHVEVSSQYYSNPTNQKNIFASKGVSILKSIASAVGEKVTENQLKSVMWTFPGSMITVDPKSGAVKWQSSPGK